MFRDYSDVYDELYDYSRVNIENTLRPLKEYYFNNPQNFNPKDHTLMEKALKFAEKMRNKEEKYREVNERERVLKKIFKEVDDFKKNKKPGDD